MVTKLCQSTIEPNSYGTSLTITGAGGFGKTSIVAALCHHSVIKKQFKDGVVFIELGPQATDPSMKLSQLYHLLTDQYLKQGDINHAEQEINQLTSLYCRNLLVIIDDVWHVEDAEPIVKAFSSSKIVLTTRMNDIEQYIPTKQIVSIGPMEQSEAISLLTSGVIDSSKLSQEDVSLLDELAQDVHLWPLLLSLVRGQLVHNLKRYHLPNNKAIKNVQAKLHTNGLTALDKNNIERSRKYAVKSCIQVTLELLTKALSDKMKSLILWTGIGLSLQTEVLHYLWNITEHEALDIVDVLWNYGLVQFTEVAMPPQNSTQHCVEVHAVISQYIIECMEGNEVITLSPFGSLGTFHLLQEGLYQMFRRCSGLFDTSLLSCKEFLICKLNELENYVLPYQLKLVNMYTMMDPLNVPILLKQIKDIVISSKNITVFLPSLGTEIGSVCDRCNAILKGVHQMSRKFNQNAQRCLAQRNYHNLIQAVKTYYNEYPMVAVVQQVLAIVNRIIPYFEEDSLCHFKEKFVKMTPEYHVITTWTLPIVKLYTKQLQRIHTSLQAGLPEIEATYDYFLGGQANNDYQLVHTNRLNRLKEAAPNWLHMVKGFRQFM